MSWEMLGVWVAVWSNCLILQMRKLSMRRPRGSYWFLRAGFRLEPPPSDSTLDMYPNGNTCSKGKKKKRLEKLAAPQNQERLLVILKRERKKFQSCLPLFHQIDLQFFSREGLLHCFSSLCGAKGLSRAHVVFSSILTCFKHENFQ